MSGYVSNFLDYTVEYLTDLKIKGKQVTEDDIISVQVGSDIVTWECFNMTRTGIPRSLNRGSNASN